MAGVGGGGIVVPNGDEAGRAPEVNMDRPATPRAFTRLAESGPGRRAGGWVRSRWFPLGVLLAVALAVGIWIGDDYGASVDELGNFLVGADAIQAYLSPSQFHDYLEAGAPLGHHGPSYFMTFFVTSKVIASVFTGWHRADGLHLSNFITFLLGLAAFYWLALRLMPARFAVMSSLLLLTQPLLFGHAFVNQKDTPFLAFFTLSLAVGISAAESAAANRSRVPVPGPNEQAVGRSSPHEGHDAQPRLRRALWGALAFVALGLVVDLLYLDWTLDGAEAMLRGVLGTAPGMVSGGAGSGAFDSDPGVELAVNWLTQIYRVGRASFVVLAIGLAVPAASKALPRKSALHANLTRKSVSLAIAAGLLVGYTAALRPIGLFAGVLVVLDWGLRSRGKGWLWLFLYGLAAGWAMLQLWPWLWEAPIPRLLASMNYTADFGLGHTIYRGASVASGDIPWHYFPTLAAIELTLPMLVLFPWGVGAAVIRVRSGRIDLPLLCVLALWLLVPLLALLTGSMGVYNNLRQLHFVLLPGFLLAGLALESLLGLLRHRLLRYAVFAALLAPGIIGIVRLHPYEYAYFNALVGGVEGAQGEYATEYWCTSLREATAYLNAQAAPDSLILVMGAHRAVEPFARQDLRVTRVLERMREADYLVTCKDNLGRDRSGEGWTKVFEVTRGEAVFAEVFERYKQ